MRALRRELWAVFLCCKIQYKAELYSRYCYCMNHSHQDRRGHEVWDHIFLWWLLCCLRQLWSVWCGIVALLWCHHTEFAVARKGFNQPLGWLLSKTEKIVLARVCDNWNTHAVLVELLTGATTIESSVVAPQKIKCRITTWFRNSTSGYIPRRIGSKVLKRYLYTHVHWSIIHHSQEVEATQVCINGWRDKQNIYLYT